MSWEKLGDIFVNLELRIALRERDLKELWKLWEPEVRSTVMDVQTLDLRVKPWRVPQDQLDRIWEQYPRPRVGRAEGLDILSRLLKTPQDLTKCLIAVANYKLYAEGQGHSLRDYKPKQFQVWARHWSNWIPDKDSVPQTTPTDFGQLPF